jgi:uncharacterized membrane protein YczE
MDKIKELFAKVLAIKNFKKRLFMTLFGVIICAISVGTIITAFFMGPLIEFFNVHVARPILKDKEEI